MRVLHVTQTYYPDTRGGIEEVIRQIALNTKKFGVETRVFALSKKPIPTIIEIDGVKIYRAPLTAKIASCGMSISALKQFKNLVDWAQVVNYHFPWPFMDLLHLVNNCNAKIVVTYHSDIVRQKRLLLLYKPLMKIFLNQADVIVATSVNYVTSSKVLQQYKEKVTTIEIGISKENYPIPTKHELTNFKDLIGQDFFLFIGTLREYKGLKFLLNALKDTKLKCVIAGSGPELKRLKILAKDLKLKNILFLGRVSETDKVSLIKLCHAIVLPSYLRSEAFGVILLEGAMYKKPLISTELNTGTSHININGETGLVVPARDKGSLRESMLLLKNNKRLAKKMGQAAFKRYNKFFKGRLMGNKYTKIYQELIKS
ncbi:glycosyltransferase [Methylophilales bacterium]|nr:glycosyltransferase [Methylophilales bacterium]